MFKKSLAAMLAVYALPSAASTIGIVGAMDVEVEALLPKIENQQVKQIGSHTFYTGEIEGKEVIVTKSGVGKVNAAMTTTLLIQSFGVEQLIFTGIAGASEPKLDPLDVVISTSLVQHDVDLTMFGKPKGELPDYEDRLFYADKNLQKHAFDAAVDVLGKESVYQGIIASGDQFIANKEVVTGIYKEFNAMAVEMEGAALGQVADAFNVPYVVIRTISDKADGSAEVVYSDLKKATADNSAKITLNMLKRM
ncbi:putative 5'-methylthioadenosine/S-adenosylhomocy steine nuclosidase [Vibrio ichthyoenteri ATCC 700023]|uniref:adenosylhomocysteine nucleosidase n=1 Tax=Vibrio ichthyoenteri ATCC 700023 TaxID=870968 RepID=F9S154_9VIBR|nr:5'-methylthioadenosine/adenosylhomocysteine nucleosidase [Vibrio ichthyoenteri]EGU42391.1 putative 5'-methylthioadenosine/S-adenosylhomocy steine nuclosidase [Vibrio ichthyoenteri ATCC 700023]